MTRTIIAALLIVLAFTGGSEATSGWGVRATAQQAGPDDQQVLTLWSVQTPSGMHACVTANYGAGHSSNRPLTISCDWNR